MSVELCTENLDKEPTIKKELTWGLSQRDQRKLEQMASIHQKRSPFNLPFEVCRLMQEIKRNLKRMKKKSKNSSALDSSSTKRSLEKIKEKHSSSESYRNVPKKKLKKEKKKRSSSESGSSASKEELEKKEKKPKKKKKTPVSISELFSETPKRKSKKKNKKATFPELYSSAPKVTLIERSALPQKEYMKLLSTPNYRPQKRSPEEKKRLKKKKICCKCTLLPLCRPRLLQMAIPNKRYVWENWKAYQHFLPAETLVRFDQILRSGNNLEPTIARCHFKMLQRKKRKELRRMRKLRKKMKELARNGKKKWFDKQIEKTAEIIVQYLKKEPLLLLNHQQMEASHILINFFAKKKVIKPIRRHTKNAFKKTLLEISDKLVTWMDGVVFSTDIQPIDSKEELGIIEVSSLESVTEEEVEESEEAEKLSEEPQSEIKEEEEGIVLGEEKAESEVETESEDETEYERVQKEDEEVEAEKAEGEKEGEIEGGEAVGEKEEVGAEGEEDLVPLIKKEGEEDEGEQFEAKRILDKIKIFDQYEDQGFIADLLNNLGEDILEKLIQILSESSAEFLADPIDSYNLPGITYGDVLTKLKEIRDGNLLEQQRPVIPLEEKMIEWAKENDPDQVDEKVLDKIHETSMILGEFFKNVSMSKGASALKPLASYDQEKGEEGEEEIEGQEEGQDTEWRPGAIQEAEEQGEGEFEGEEGMGEWEKEGEEEAKTEEDMKAEELMDEEEGLRGEEDEEEGEGEDLEGEYEDFVGKEDVEGKEDLEGKEEGVEGAEEVEDFAEGVTYGGITSDEEEGEEISKLAQELERLDSFLKIIRGHTPSKVFEHSPGTICCLSLKIWAVWLLEIANNAHNWTKWIGDIIRQVRHYAAIIRGDVSTPSGQKKVLYKDEWRQFVKDTEEKVIAWRQYSKHVKDLSGEIMENFHGKPVNCCPKCLQDHLIKNVVSAHETLQALTEAINCADYWQRCLDRIVEQTSKFAGMDMAEEEEEEEVAKPEGVSEDSLSVIEFEELTHVPAPIVSETSYDSVLEIEEIAVPGTSDSGYEVLEVSIKPKARYFEIDLVQELEDTKQPTASVKSKSEKTGKKQKGEKAAKAKNVKAAKEKKKL